MAITITGLGGSAPVRPVVSAVVEFGSALHVLRDPGHHGAERWAADTWAKMSPRLAGRTELWWWTTQAIRATPFVTAAPADDFDEWLARLRAMPVRELAGQLLRPIAPSGDPATALHWCRSREPAVRALVETLVAHPEEAVPDFLEFAELSRREWFAAEWTRVRPLLAARARTFADLTRRRGTAAALATLDPSVTVTAPDEAVSVAKVQNARHDVSRRGLTVAPSTFIHPHLYVADLPGRPLLIIHPVEPGTAVPPAAELLRRLDVVAHPGRLEVARAIATEPRTAGEIAALWKMDPTLVTRHLRALASAGLACPIRQGRFVRYRLDAETVAALGTDLLALLLR